MICIFFDYHKGGTEMQLWWPKMG